MFIHVSSFQDLLGKGMQAQHSSHANKRLKHNLSASGPCRWTGSLPSCCGLRPRAHALCWRRGRGPPDPCCPLRPPRYPAFAPPLCETPGVPAARCHNEHCRRRRPEQHEHPRRRAGARNRAAPRLRSPAHPPLAHPSPRHHLRASCRQSPRQRGSHAAPTAQRLRVDRVAVRRRRDHGRLRARPCGAPGGRGAGAVSVSRARWGAGSGDSKPLGAAAASADCRPLFAFFSCTQARMP